MSSSDSFDEFPKGAVSTLSDSFEEFPKGAVKKSREEIMSKLNSVHSSASSKQASKEDSFDEFPSFATKIPRALVLNKSRKRASQDDSFDVFPAHALKRSYADIVRTVNIPLAHEPLYSSPISDSFDDSFPPLCAPLATSTPVKIEKKKKPNYSSLERSPELEPFPFTVKVTEEKPSTNRKKKNCHRNLTKVFHSLVPKPPNQSKRGVKRQSSPLSTDQPPVAKRREPLLPPREPVQELLQAVNHRGVLPALQVANQRRQYGGARRRNMPARGFVKKRHFPTTEEEQFFADNVILSKVPHLKRQNAAYLALDTVRMKLIRPEDVKDEVLHIHVGKLLDIFIRAMIKKAGGNLKKTRYWLQISHPGYHEQDGFFVTHKTYAAVDGGVIMNKIAHHMQSNKEIMINDSFTVTMNVFKEKKSPMTGRGDLPPKGVRTSIKIRDFILKDQFGVCKNRILGESHCLPKALALGKMESDIKSMKDDDTQKKELEKKFRSLTRKDKARGKYQINCQLKAAKALLEDAQMDVSQEEHGREDLKKLAAHLSDYQIIVWTAEGRQTVPVEHERFNPNGKKFIGLFFYEGHYEFINHIKGKRPARFCYKCFKFADDNHYLHCAAKCYRCGTTDCEPLNENIHCAKCNIYFRSRKCFDAHLVPVSNKADIHCDKYFRCPKCLIIDRTDRFRRAPHVCGLTTFCKVCKEKKLKDHECSHPLPTAEQKEKKREKQRDWAVLVYDMECIVAESGEFNGHVERGPKHEPNLICVRMFCSKCRGKDGCGLCCQPWTYSYKDQVSQESEDTNEEEEEEDIFEVKEKHTPLARFATFLLHNTRANNAYIIAHNGGRYDHVMLLAELDRQTGIKSKEPKILLNGMTIISGEFKYEKQTLHFRDSLQYLQMPLAKMPGAFGLDGEAKGFFPHLYNHPDNYPKDLQTLPPKEYYSPQFMAPATRNEFDIWYTESYGNGFVLHEELLKYCQSDVRILTLTLIAFIEMCETAFSGWNPLVNGCTLASYVMFVLKHVYIKPGDVGYVPENGLDGDNNSVLALKYLQWLEKCDPTLQIKYSLHGGEYRIRANGRSYKADGYNEATKEVYEIYGCIWHGCPKCHPIQDKACPMRPDNVSMKSLYDDTMQRQKDIESVGYIVHAKWECEIYEEMTKNRKMKKFFDLNNYTTRLQPREALFGGRTQAFRSITEACEEFDVNYFDFVSMYPYLNAGGTAYPRGNPIKMIRDFPDVNEPLKLRGFVHCDVLPKQDASIGYLPERISNKLMFTLCRTCAEKQNISGPCTHVNVSERFLTGVWMTDEFNKAISRGYKVLKYHEIWYWPENRWVKGGFFADYIKPLLALKHQSSGWPKEDMTEEEKKEYVARILEKDGVTLDPSKIKKNKALRSLTKIFLNSAWGKFAQNPMKVETRLIWKSDAAELTNFFNDPRFEPTAMIPYGEKKLFISRKPKKEMLKPTAFTNLAIAAITTSAARLRLTEAMERVGIENMIYCDTDSLIFKQKKDGDDPLEDLKGEQLGFLTNEIPPGKELVEVVAMAPKTYALKMKAEDGTYSYSVKAKGFTLNSGNAEKITFDTMKKSMKEFIEDGFAEPLEGEMLSFKRGDNALDGLWTCTLKKHLNPRMDKGHYVDGVVTPFGQLPSHVKLIDDYPF